MTNRGRRSAPELEGGAATDRKEHVDARTPCGCRPPTPVDAPRVGPDPRWGPVAGEEYLTLRPPGPARQDRRSLRPCPCREYPPSTRRVARRRRKTAHADDASRTRDVHARLLPRRRRWVAGRAVGRREGRVCFYKD